MWPFRKKTPYTEILREIKEEPKFAKRRGYVDCGKLSSDYLFLWMYDCRARAEEASCDHEHLWRALGYAFAGSISPPREPTGKWSSFDRPLYYFADVHVEKAFFLSVLRDDCRAEMVTAAMLEASILGAQPNYRRGFGAEPEIIGYYRAVEALARGNAKQAEDAWRLVQSAGREAVGYEELYARAIYAVLANSGVEEAFGRLHQEFLDRRGCTDNPIDPAEGGFEGKYVDHILDYRGLAIAKLGHRRGLDVGVDTEFIPRRLYTETVDWDPMRLVENDDT